MASIRPNHTIYVHNLNDKVKKLELRHSLYCLFSQFGKVIDVVALKTHKMRGQAFIIFKDIESASSALRAMQGFPFYDRQMKIEYSKKDSEVIAKIKGTYVDSLKNKKQPGEGGEGVAKKKKRGPPAPSTDHGAQAINQGPAGAGLFQQKKRAERAQQDTTTTAETDRPNKTLFVSRLPSDTTKNTMNMLFNQFPGLTSVRMIENRPDIAFVDYQTENQCPAS